METQISFIPDKKQTWRIFVDGASRNNPGPAGAGIYITCDNAVIIKAGYFLGDKTNNQAEYLALLLALFLAEEEIAQREIEPPQFEVFSDSELMVKQITGLYRMKNLDLAKIKKLIDILLENKSYKITHVLREKNKMADKLANNGIDSKKELPKNFVNLLARNDIEI